MLGPSYWWRQTSALGHVWRSRQVLWLWSDLQFDQHLCNHVSQGLAWLGWPLTKVYVYRCTSDVHVRRSEKRTLLEARDHFFVVCTESHIIPLPHNLAQFNTLSRRAAPKGIDLPLKSQTSTSGARANVDGRFLPGSTRNAIGSS